MPGSSLPAPNHYETLGVSPTAGTAEIREAYRRLARQHHPDRAASSSADSTVRSMPAINEAYRVLSDPARRAVYDAGLRGRVASERGPAAQPHATGTDRSAADVTFPSHLGPARVPWRSVLFFATIAIIGVVVLAQFTEPGEPRGPDGILGVGSCVVIEANGDAREVSCTDDPAIDLVVEAFVPFDAACPTGTVAHRDRQGMGVACVADTSEIRG